MSMPFLDFLSKIEKGFVFIDKNFRFIDGKIREKWLISLSSIIEGDFFVYCLSTSKLNTYKSSFSDIVKTSDPVFNRKTIIIEVERINLFESDVLEKKFNKGDLVYIGKLQESTINEIMDTIECSSRIPEYLKDYLDL